MPVLDSRLMIRRRSRINQLRKSFLLVPTDRGDSAVAGVLLTLSWMIMMMTTTSSAPSVTLNFDRYGSGQSPPVMKGKIRVEEGDINLFMSVKLVLITRAKIQLCQTLQPVFGSFNHHFFPYWPRYFPDRLLMVVVTSWSPSSTKLG